jgi:hypothetical protein
MVWANNVGKILRSLTEKEAKIEVKENKNNPVIPI